MSQPENRAHPLQILRPELSSLGLSAYIFIPPAHIHELQKEHIDISPAWKNGRGLTIPIEDTKKILTGPYGESFLKTLISSVAGQVREQPNEPRSRTILKAIDTALHEKKLTETEALLYLANALLSLKTLAQVMYGDQVLFQRYEKTYFPALVALVESDSDLRDTERGEIFQKAIQDRTKLFNMLVTTLLTQDTDDLTDQPTDVLPVAAAQATDTSFLRRNFGQPVSKDDQQDTPLKNADVRKMLPEEK